MIREQRKKKRRRKIGLTVVLILLMLLAIAFLIVWKVFTVENVVVEGNELYSSEQIEQLVLNDEYSWNSLYVLLKYRIRDTGKVPFVDTMEVTLDDPHTVHVLVYEKGILGQGGLERVLDRVGIESQPPILTRMDSSWRLLRTRLRMYQRSPE